MTTQYVRIECSYVCQYTAEIMVESEDEFGDVEQFLIPESVILDKSAINALVEIMELEITLEWAEKAGIKYYE